MNLKGDIDNGNWKESSNDIIVEDDDDSHDCNIHLLFNFDNWHTQDRPEGRNGHLTSPSTHLVIILWSL